MSAKKGTSALDILRTARESRGDSDLFGTMTVPDYLDAVIKNPEISRRAWSRLYDMVVSHGVTEYTEFGQKRAHFSFFDDPFDGRDALFGADIALEGLMNKLKSAAAGHATARRILLLHGPVGSAKSTIARLFKKGLENYSRSEAGRMYTFKWTRRKHLGPEVYDAIYGKGIEEIRAPMQPDPIYLIDPRDQPAFANAVAASGKGSIIFKGELDPLSQVVYNMLYAKLGDWEKVMDHIVVERLILSEPNRIGIGTFQPKDEKNQDATELTGSINFRRIAVYGSDSDPRAFNFDGEFQVANRGIIEFVELLKLDTAFLYDLLTASEEGRIKPKKFAQCSIDTVIIGHNNEPELKKLEADQYMEALRNRTVALKVPYVTKVSAEAKIYERDHKHDKVHIAPHTFKVAAFWSVASRLEEPKGGLATVLQKVKLYDGEHVATFTDETVKEMRKANPREGMDGGISPRTIQDIFDSILAKSTKSCVTPFNFLREAEAQLRFLPLDNETARERYTKLLSVVEEEYRDIVQTDVRQAIAANAERAQEVFERYLDNIEAYCSDTKIKNPATGREEEPDENFMSEIESRAEVATSNKRDFRLQTLAWFGRQTRAGATITYKSNEQLRKAIDVFLFDKQKDTIHLSSLVTPGAVSPETQEKIDIVKTRLVKEYGYCEHCASVVLSYVASVFARSEAK